MLTSDLNYGIPDIDLSWTSGGTINPSCFAGHQLLVLFLPADEREQAAEIDSYERLAGDVAETDAWFLVVGTGQEKAPAQRKNPVVLDPEGKGWLAFKKLAKDAKLKRPDGAAFVFTRGGALHRVWPGRGHASEVLQELLSRG